MLCGWKLREILVSIAAAIKCRSSQEQRFYKGRLERFATMMSTSKLKSIDFYRYGLQ